MRKRNPVYNRRCYQTEYINRTTYIVASELKEAQQLHSIAAVQWEKIFINEKWKYYWKKWSRDWKERRQTSNRAENGSDDHKMVKDESSKFKVKFSSSEILRRSNWTRCVEHWMCALSVSNGKREYSKRYKCEFAKDDLREMWNWQRCAPRSLRQSRLFSIKSVLLHPFASDSQYNVANSSLSFHRVAMRERAEIQFKRQKNQ